MRRLLHSLGYVLAVGALLALPAAVAGQAATGQFGPGYTDLGPTLGLGNIGSASISLGGRFEHGIKTLPDLGNGTLSFELGAQYYHWNCGSLGGGSCGVTYVPFGATGNYHFKLESAPKFDPFVGLGLGYEYVTCNFDGIGGCGYSSAIYFIGRLGGRYFFSPKMAAYADVGAGGAALNVGVMFAMKGARGR